MSINNMLLMCLLKDIVVFNTQVLLYPLLKKGCSCNNRMGIGSIISGDAAGLEELVQNAIR